MCGLQALVFRVVAAQLFEALRGRLQRCIFVFQAGDLIGLHSDGHDAGQENGGKGNRWKPAADKRQHLRWMHLPGFNSTRQRNVRLQSLQQPGGSRRSRRFAQQLFDSLVLHNVILRSSRPEIRFVGVGAQEIERLTQAIFHRAGGDAQRLGGLVQG